jgi:putative effector of murein hydrolase LrgA (UPF0299 family)
MIEAITVILICQLIGEGLARLSGLPIPGPVLGLLLLFLGLLARDRLKPEAAPIDSTPLGVLATFLLAHLSLLFVPAGVGIIGQAETVARHGIGLLLALVLSTAAAILVTALVFTALAPKDRGDGPGGSGA